MTKMSRVNYKIVKLFFNKEFSHRKKTLFGEKSGRWYACRPSVFTMCRIRICPLSRCCSLRKNGERPAELPPVVLHARAESFRPQAPSAPRQSLCRTPHSRKWWLQRQELRWAVWITCLFLLKKVFAYYYAEIISYLFNRFNIFKIIKRAAACCALSIGAFSTEVR